MPHAHRKLEKGVVIRCAAHESSRKIETFLMLIMRVNITKVLSGCNGSILVYNLYIVYFSYKKID